MKVFIAGGTGFLGQAALKKFTEKGAEVSAASLSGGKVGKITVDALDFFNESRSFLKEYLKSKKIDVFVYALGPDDRVMPPAPAYDYFYEKLVVKCSEILKTAVMAGAKRLIVTGSYFAYFDKMFGGKLSAFHPYIRARREQEEAVMNIGSETVVLEIPYVFGVPEKGKPIWRDSFLSHYDGYPAVFMTGGGTAATDVYGVADAVFAAAHYGKGAIPVGGVNITYIELLKKMLFYARDNRKVFRIPACIGALGARGIVKEYFKKGCEPGLDPVKLMTQIQNKKFYIDPAVTESALGYGKLGLNTVKNIDEQLSLTMRACYPERF